MRKILALIFFTLLLTSCSYSNTAGNGEKITPPTIDESPIYGTWKITKQLQKQNHNNDNDIISNIVNQNISLTDKYVIINNYYWENISYKVKLVSSHDYYTSLGYTSSLNNNLPQGDIRVFSASYNGINNICELAIKNENSGVLFIAGNLYSVEKTTKSINIEKDNLTNIKKASPVKNYTTSTKTGLVLGLKSKSKVNGDDNFSYRTLWISKEGSKLNKVYELNNITFPRRNGFWSLSEETINNNNVKENIFIPKDLSSSNTQATSIDNLITEQNQHGYSNGKIHKEINYVCNDYISVKLTGEAMRNGVLEPINKLHIYPISSLPFEKSISIEDIFKGTSLEFIRSEFFASLSSIKGDNTFLNTDESNQNIGISRRDGHWLFTGRIPYIENSTKEFVAYDYNLSLIPPSSLVYYDTLFKPLIGIKEYVPYAIDAYSSPDQSLAVVVSDRHLYLYDIVEGPLGSLQLSDDYLTKIPLKEGETIVMSEWANGSYVDSWNKVLTNLDNSKILKKLGH